MVNIQIDGNNYEVPEGVTVLEAARQAGVHIPTLCDHPKLTPYGGCRLCLVEVEGARTLQPSCTLPVNNNMVIHTDTDRIKAARKFVLTLIFSERNHFCMYCQVSGGDCELQNSAYAEGMTHWPLQPNWQPYEVDASNPFFVLDNNRCILCRRCVRACGELVGNFTLGFEERGARSFLVADLGVPLGESTCVSCGTCVQVCPTGALIDRQSAFRGREVQVDHHNTVCVGCSLGCGMDVLTRDNQLVRIEGNWEAEVNGGVLCKIGRFLPLEEKRERITTPLVRKDGRLQAATWDEALNAIVAQVRPLAGKNGSGVAAMASTRLTAEALFAFKSVFADGLHSGMVTSMEEGAYTAEATQAATDLHRSFEGKLEDLENADLVVVIGDNVMENHPVAGYFIKRILPNGAGLVVIDQAANALDVFANSALKARKGNDNDVVAGLLAAISKLGVARTGALAQPEAALIAAAEKTGISPDALVEAAAQIGAAQKPVFLYGKGVSVKTLLDLAAMTGGAVIGTKGLGNSVAAAQYGLEKAFAVDGHQAVYLALGDDTPTQRMIQNIGKPAFLAVQATYVSALTAAADVVLPVANWLEQDGHYVNLEGRVQTSVKSLQAPEDVWTNEKVLAELAARLGCTTGDWKAALTQRTPAVAIA